MAVAYDVVLEDHILPHQAVKRRARPFGREVAEMVRYAVGYQSRAFVTFGTPIPLDGFDPESRRDVMALAHQIRDAIGRLYKVLPTAVVAAAMRPSMTRRELEDARRRASSTRCGRRTRTSACTSGREAVEDGAPALADRNIIHVERGGRFRVRERTVLRYYARTHPAPARVRGAPSARTDARHRLEGFLPHARRQPVAESASRPATACATRGGFARRFIAGETVEEAIAAARAIEADRPARDARLSRRERRARSPRPTPPRAPTSRCIEQIAAAGIERNISLKLTQLGLTIDRATCVDNLRRILDAAATHEFFVRIDMENSPYTAGHARDLRDDVAAGIPQRRRRAAVVPAAQRGGRARG